MTLSIPTGTFGDLTSENNRITKNGRTVFTTLGNLALLDPAARQTTKTDAHILLDAVSKQVEKAGLTLRYVNNIRAFFNPDARWNDFLATGKVEGLELTDDERTLIREIAALRTRFDEAFSLPVVTKDYERLSIKNGVDPLKNYTVTEKTVENKDGYRAGIGTLRKLWEDASKLWAQGKTKTLAYRSMGGYSYHPRVTKTQIIFGCQNIPRAAMEALAEKKGWGFPTVDIETI